MPEMTSFEQHLAKLRNISVAVAADNIPDAEGAATVVVTFSDGTILKAHYWRLIENRLASLSSFDHRQQYGLPAPIDAKERLCDQLAGTTCSQVKFDKETADLTLVFDETTRLQIFNFTACEVWDILFPDGTGQYSNYALPEQR